MSVLFFGSYDAEAHPRVAVLVEGVGRHFDDVAECNVPLRVSTRDRVSMVSSGRRLPALAWRIASAWARLLVRARTLERADVVIVGYLGHFDVLLARVRFPRALLVLDYLVSGVDTAEDRKIGSRMVRGVLAVLDRAALAVSDVVVVDTDAQRDHLPSSARRRAVVVPVGASDAWFRTPQPGRGDRLSVVFYGTFTPLQGAVTIGQAVARLADEPIDFTIVGTGQDYEACREVADPNPNIKWIDWISGPDLPSLVQGHDVCLGIFGDSPKAQRVVPTKAFQGAAAGCLVVTSDTPVQRQVLGEAGRYVPAGDADALVIALRSLAHDDEVAGRRQRAYAWADERFRSGAVVESLVARFGARTATRS